MPYVHRLLRLSFYVVITSSVFWFVFPALEMYKGQSVSHCDCHSVCQRHVCLLHSVICLYTSLHTCTWRTSVPLYCVVHGWVYMYVEVVYFSLLRTHTTQDSCRVFIDCTFHGLILYNVFIIYDASCFFLWTKLPVLCFIVMRGSRNDGNTRRQNCVCILWLLSISMCLMRVHFCWIIVYVLCTILIVCMP